MIDIIDISFINESKSQYGNSEVVKKIDCALPNDNSFLTSIYRNEKINYPKFHKMDNLCKAGYLCALSITNNNPYLLNSKSTSVICFNREASLESDKNYTKTIIDNDNYFPAPALFVYTLPNIVTGEICISNKIFGESSMYITENFNCRQIAQQVIGAFDTKTEYVLAGWLDCLNSRSQALFMLFGGSKEEHDYEKIMSKLNTINSKYL